MAVVMVTLLIQYLPDGNIDIITTCLPPRWS